mmetsp:Transcript_1755/g.2420  ORF Transcript_1755/g.2420 Transcript_1755/m.2420 type:complete len:248 (+) Transcript_1755:132-875(+)|eukprot:CAMPEP_0178895692 /NCGR_PEP_ID=MMETSP0786-20121207/730_1 /TAXON_ID=186022 /ORGANISM="Thalassionema frauenfeldii, Strain CCMP 1798" /LENGTH=247 /DNA_ID=CAMNT_0020565955 /DNA_START=99 /DNA_END=842 /DNA_ORIENTATION=+
MIGLDTIGKIIVVTAALLGTLRYGAGLYAWRVAERLEKPAYTIIKRLSGGVELRQYEPYLIAETTLAEGGFSARDGFRTCAGYIFGKNRPRRGFLASNNDASSEKMAMTAPVRISGETKSSVSKGENMKMTAPVRITGGIANQKRTKVSFVIGSKYSLSSAPRPLDKNVKIREVKSHTLAVRTFSGPPPTNERVEEERVKIEKILAKENVLPKSNSETLVYGYHDPVITPNLLRKNEVGVAVESRSW